MNISRLRRCAAPLAVLAVLFTLLSFTGIAPAAADTPSSGGDVQVAQTMGDRELTLVLRRVTAVPGPLRIDVITHAGTPPGTLALTATPTEASAASGSAGTVSLGPTPGSYGTTLEVDRAGPWELAVNDGERIARIPFVVASQATSMPDYAVYFGFGAAGVLLIGTVLVAVRARNGRWALLPAGGVVAGLSVAITAAVLSGSLPLPPQPGTQLDPTGSNAANPYALTQPLIADYSRPPAMLSIVGPAPVAGRPADVTLGLADGSTGLPVDDLVIHDGALLHLLVVGPCGQLWHVHPIRVAPGVLQVRLTLPSTGHYAVSAELVRRGGGVQVVRSATGIDVTTGPAAIPAPPPVAVVAARTANTTVAGNAVALTTTAAPAGAATTITATFGTVADLQPRLGMIGHMIIAGPLPDAATDLGAAVQNVPVWAHAHSMGDLAPPGPNGTGGMGDMAGMGGMSGMDGTPAAGSGMAGMAGLMPVNGDSAVDETVAAYGPDISFTFTFPQPGRYRVWIQAERDFRLLTVPAVVDVPAAGVRP